MKKIPFLLIILPTFIFAQQDIKIKGSIGYNALTTDYYEIVLGNTRYSWTDYTMRGLSLNIGAGGSVPITDIVKFDADVYINYVSVSESADEDFDLGFSEARTSLVLKPKIKFEQEEKKYVGIGLPY